MGAHPLDLERAVLAALDRGERLDPDALLFLLRRASVSSGDELAERAGAALAEALPETEQPLPIPVGAAWVALLVEARQLSDDPRLDAALSRLLAVLRDHWTAPPIANAAAALDATLRAAHLEPYRAAAPAAVDELERLIGRFYRPGGAFGEFVDGVHTASALLTAYGLSGRLPYSMLAEELVHQANRMAAPDFVTACLAARVLCRLAALHADPEYRARAVVTPHADYGRDAARLLSAAAGDPAARGSGRGIYALALLELESASSLS